MERSDSTSTAGDVFDHPEHPSSSSSSLVRAGYESISGSISEPASSNLSRNSPSSYGTIVKAPSAPPQLQPDKLSLLLGRNSRSISVSTPRPKAQSIDVYSKRAMCPSCGSRLPCASGGEVDGRKGRASASADDPNESIVSPLAVASKLAVTGRHQRASKQLEYGRLNVERYLKMSAFHRRRSYGHRLQQLSYPPTVYPPFHPALVTSPLMRDRRCSLVTGFSFSFSSSCYPACYNSCIQPSSVFDDPIALRRWNSQRSQPRGTFWRSFDQCTDYNFATRPARVSFSAVPPPPPSGGEMSGGGGRRLTRGEVDLIERGILKRGKKSIKH